MSETPEVIQGRLGWEPGDVSKADPENLKPHPKNKEIYGDTDTPSDLTEPFVESVRENGVLEPLVITRGKKIVSGHRRWLAAKATATDTVPVRYTEFDDDLSEREALVEFNRQREKTPGQVVNEFEEMLAIEKERGRDSQGSGPTSTKNLVEVDGDAQTRAAEKINANVSGETLRKGKKVKEKAESGDETAQREWEKLQDGDTSFHRAKKNVEKAEAEEAIEADREAGPQHEYQPTVEQADAIEWLKSATWGRDCADVLVTDPPFVTDVDDIESFAKEWVPAALRRVTADGYAYIFVGSYAEELRAYLNTLAEFPSWYVQPLVWNYRNTLGQSPDNRYKRDWQAILYCRGPDAGTLSAPKTSELRSVQEVNAPGMIGDDSERHHKWQKPRPLLEQYIRHATDQGDLVVDPFAGSGEVLLTAADTGRRAAGCDIDEEAVATAAKRGCVVNE